MSESLLKLLGSLLIAIALGALIGAERGIARVRQQEDEKSTFAGIRTFILISLLGALSLNFSIYFGKVFFVASFFGFALLVTSSYLITSKREKDLGTTTEITAILTFLYGALCLTEYRLIAVVLAIFTAVILYAKKPAHKFIGRITDDEFYATLKFAIIAFVILPFLPKDDYLGFFNPYRIWLIVVIVSGIEFVGYVIMKFMPPRKGIAIMGLLGGIVSSTALVLNASRESKREGTLTNTLAFSSALASSTVFLKLIIEVYIVNKSLVKAVSPPLFLMFVLGMLSAFFLWRRGKGEEATSTIDDLKSPFTLRPALKFAVFFAFIIFLVTFANRYLGVGGVYITSAIGGLANLDAPTVSLASLAYKQITGEVVTLGILIAACVNTILKVGIALLLGSKDFSKLVMLSLSFPIIGAIAYMALIMYG
ncbi:MAG: MgtC/SapB family protein [Candidatus Dadabacteria bacterium]|nr:MgtC/SapB family protein [Candidatus Dadabacteria bacterium]